MPKLRRFLYLDDDIVGQFLAQVEGGEFDEQRITDVQGSSSGLGGSVKAGPAAAHAERGRSESSQAETVLRQSGPSRFNRLHQILSADHDLASVHAVDDEIWEGLEVGEILEVVVTMEVPEFHRTMDQMSGLSAIVPLLDAFSEVASLGIPDLEVPAEKLKKATDMKQVIPAMAGMADAVRNAPLPVVMHLSDAPAFRFLVVLERSRLSVPLSEIDGDARALVKVDKLATRGKPLMVATVPGVPQQSRAQRRASGGTADSANLTLKAPAALASCVAIYR